MNLPQKTDTQLSHFIYQIKIFLLSRIIIRKWSIQSPESSKIPKIYFTKFLSKITVNNANIVDILVGKNDVEMRGKIQINWKETKRGDLCLTAKRKI